MASSSVQEALKQEKTVAKLLVMTRAMRVNLKQSMSQYYIKSTRCHLVHDQLHNFYITRHYVGPSPTTQEFNFLPWDNLIYLK